MTDFPERVIFVGGAPRSGTTVTQALICASPLVNDQQPEISFYRGHIQAFEFGLRAWPQHTSSFFQSVDDFRAYCREVSDGALRRIWAASGSPKYLCVKDPHLTPLFPALAHLYGDEARFVTVARHPDFVVRSRQAVAEKAGQPFGRNEVASVAREYANYYAAVLNAKMADRHCTFRYEELGPKLLANVGSFLGLGSLSAETLSWAEQNATNDPWHSPKYGGGIDVTPRFSPLKPEWSAIVARICGPVMKFYGYEPLGQSPAAGGDISAAAG